jgi:hypothetical protein
MTSQVSLAIALAALLPLAAIPAPAPAPAPAYCTHVEKTGVCSTRFGIPYCFTGNGVGTLTCPDGMSHQSSSAAPDPCMPAGATCVRKVYCCADEDLPRVRVRAWTRGVSEPPRGLDVFPRRAAHCRGHEL